LPGRGRRSRARAGEDTSLRARAHERNGGTQRSDGGGDRVINSFRLLSGFFSGFCPFRDVTRALLRLRSRERAATRVHAPRFLSPFFLHRACEAAFFPFSAARLLDVCICISISAGKAAENGRREPNFLVSEGRNCERAERRGERKDTRVYVADGIFLMTFQTR